MIRSCTWQELPEKLREQLKGSLFYSRAYVEYLEHERFSPVFLYDEAFILLAALRQKLFFRFADLPSEHLRIGPEGEAKAFLDDCMEHLRTVHQVQWVNHPHTNALFDEAPSKGIRIPYSSHMVNLEASLEEIFAGFDSANRNRIRKAEEKDIQVVCGGEELLDPFLALDNATRIRAGMKLGERSYYADLLRFLPENTKICIASCNGVDQAASFVLCDSGCCHYIYGASADEVESGAVNFLIWDMLKRMKAQGIRRFSFSGARVDPTPDSKHSGINRFKKRFTTTLQPCYLFKVVFSPWRYRLYRLLADQRLRMKGSVPQGDIIDQEIDKWQQLNEAKDLARIYPGRFT